MSQVGQINVLFSLQMATEAKNSPVGSFSSKAGGLEGVLDLTNSLVVAWGLVEAGAGGGVGAKSLIEAVAGGIFEAKGLMEAWARGVVEAKVKVEAGAGGVVEACLGSFFLH